MWIPKPLAKSHTIFLVPLGLLLLKMEASRNCSSLCHILENYLVLASESKLSLSIRWSFFVSGNFFWHFLVLSSSFNSFCLLAYLLVPYHSLVPSWGVTFLPEHLNFHVVFFPWGQLLTLFFLMGLSMIVPCCPLLAMVLGCYWVYFSF